MDEIKTVLSEIGGYFSSAAWYPMVKWPFWVLLFTVAAGGVYCARFGKKTLLCRSVSGTLNLCGIYQAAFILYTRFGSLRSIPFTLPFLNVTEESVSLMNVLELDLSVLAPMLLQLMFLQLLVDFVEHLNPGGKTFLSWLLSQLITVLVSLGFYLVIIAGCHFLLPCIGGQYAIIPVALAGLVFLGMVCAKLIFTVVLESGNPDFKKAYDFFTGHKVGSLLTVSIQSFLLTAGVFTIMLVTGASRLVFLRANMTGLLIVLMLLMLAEYIFAMFYCGKKK